MKTLFRSVSLILFLSSPALAKEMVFSLGETQSLNLRGNPSVWIQDREILKAEGQGSKLLLRAGREGRTTLKVGSDIYQIQVLHPNKTDALGDLKTFLQGIVGISAKISDGDLLLSGTLYRMQDWIKIADFARRRNLQYQMRAMISEDLRAEAQDFFRQLLENAKVPPQTVIFEPAPEIRINSAELSFKKYQTLFSPYGVLAIKDENSLEVAPTIKVEITVAEIKRSFSRTHGLKWPTSYSAAILSDGTWGRKDLPFEMKAMEDSGNGKILASPNILCRSGKEAEFLAGGEFPIRVVGYKSADVLWKRYGIQLKVKPKADSAGRISISIETEVTTLDYSVKVEGVPGTLTNRVSSHFDLTRPQTIALSGLLKNDEGNSSEGLPLLSRLPVLGALFASKDYHENRSELVIFVRPTILKESEDGRGLSHLDQGGSL